ncbi:DUF2283 domain-containing protein [Paraburkholderia sp. UCT31]|uniref:DUF2283 domain-containing protein n=1 Tax=Paraburkholderia sp. UCT31 TaxID=2615209 RepID=UPI001CA3B395|nr:DUF2283 domain-containing protein [Paraburkholderia sp. UCT31]
MMRIEYDDGEDILHITFLNATIVRDVSQTWNVNLGFSETGLAEITILEAKANNYWPIENVERRMIQEGLDDVTAGRLVPMSKVREWADSIGTDNEKAIPECSSEASAAPPRGEPMSTKATLAYHPAEGDEPSWHLYEELGESRVVYLELENIDVELFTRDPRSRGGGGVNLVLRLPIETATQLGLPSIVPPDRWKSACNPDKLGNLRRGLTALRRLRGSVSRYDDPTEPAPGSEEP